MPAAPPAPRSAPAGRTRRRGTPASLHRNDVAAVGAGVGLWLLALCVLYGLQASGAAAIPQWGIWTAVAGALVGLYGAYFLWRRERRLRR